MYGRLAFFIRHCLFIRVHYMRALLPIPSKTAHGISIRETVQGRMLRAGTILLTRNSIIAVSKDRRSIGPQS